MSKLKQNTTIARIIPLLKTDSKIFHIKDLGNLWAISNQNTLRITVNRYSQRGLLYSIFRGLYSLIPPSQIDPALLGSKIIHGYCYQTTETILYEKGIINQKIAYQTFVGEKSLRFDFQNNHFLCRQLKPDFLYNPAGTYIEKGFRKASTERAVADLLYFNPKYHFDQKIDWRKVRQIQKEIGYPLTPNRYDFTAGR